MNGLALLGRRAAVPGTIADATDSKKGDGVRHERTETRMDGLPGGCA